MKNYIAIGALLLLPGCIGDIATAIALRNEQNAYAAETKRAKEENDLRAKKDAEIGAEAQKKWVIAQKQRLEKQAESERHPSTWTTTTSDSTAQEMDPGAAQRATEAQAEYNARTPAENAAIAKREYDDQMQGYKNDRERCVQRIAEERASARISGVVDLEALHDAGWCIHYYDRQIEELKATRSR